MKSYDTLSLSVNHLEVWAPILSNVIVFFRVIYFFSSPSPPINYVTIERKMGKLQWRKCHWTCECDKCQFIKAETELWPDGTNRCVMFHFYVLLFLQLLQFYLKMSSAMVESATTIQRALILKGIRDVLQYTSRICGGNDFTLLIQIL